jgi:hypothetical protein
VALCKSPAVFETVIVPLRPGDLLEALAATEIPGAVMVFAGDGPLRQSLY